MLISLNNGRRTKNSKMPRTPCNRSTRPSWETVKLNSKRSSRNVIISLSKLLHWWWKSKPRTTRSKSGQSPMRNLNKRTRPMCWQSKTCKDNWNSYSIKFRTWSKISRSSNTIRSTQLSWANNSRKPTKESKTSSSNFSMRNRDMMISIKRRLNLRNSTRVRSTSMRHSRMNWLLRIWSLKILRQPFSSWLVRFLIWTSRSRNLSRDAERLIRREPKQWNKWPREIRRLWSWKHRLVMPKKPMNCSNKRIRISFNSLRIESMNMRNWKLK